MKKNNKSSQDTVRIPFRFLNTAAASSGAKTLSVSPLLTPRLTILADTFDEYRFTKLSFRLHPTGTADTSIETACFEPGVVDTPPATNSAQSESLACAISTGAETTPSNWVTVPKGVLAGYQPWYKSVAGTPETAEEVQGNIFCFNSNGASDSTVVELSGICEFRGAINTSSTPADRIKAARMKERDRLVALLALGTPGKKGSA